MLQIVIGLFFVLVDFNLQVGSSVVGVIPDFIGYILLIVGINKESARIPRLEKLKLYTFVMIFYSLFMYAIDAVGLSGSLGILTTLCGIVVMLYSLYITYAIIKGIADVEQAQAVDLHSGRLKFCWLAITGLNVLSYLIALLAPAFLAYAALATLCVNLVFIFTFYQTYRLYIKCAFSAQEMKFVPEQSPNAVG